MVNCQAGGRVLTSVRHRSRRRLVVAKARATDGLPLVVDLVDAAGRPDVAGAKAANLAIAAAAGLRVLPGLVLTERLCDTLVSAALLPSSPAAREVATALRTAWESAGGARHTLVVRSSSRSEDGSVSSLAGQFTSVLGVKTFGDFLAAVDEVVQSAKLITLDDGKAHRQPMAVLVQPQLEAVYGGVLFGIDPVSGRTDRLVAAAVHGLPDQLVSGRAPGTTHVLSRRGRIITVHADASGPRLRWGTRRRLAALSARVAEVFGSPQDIEWATDSNGVLWLLQSRPVTTAPPAAARKSRLFGPGPVAETFPDPLSPLEGDLWLGALNAGLREALILTGVASRRRLESAPPVVAVAGRAAVDLEVLGSSPLPRSWFSHLNPVPPARRLLAAWRTGRLRAALPNLAAEIVRRADGELASVRPPATLPAHQLLAVLDGSHQALVALHGYEVLIGLLAGAAPGAGEAASAKALRALAEGRHAGLTDAEIVTRDPVVLTLVPPAVRPATMLPPAAPLASSRPAASITASRAVDELLALREELRLRARWLHELTAFVAWELGTRLHASGILPAAGAVRWLQLDELRAAVNGVRPPEDLSSRRERPSPPLPAAFRLSLRGDVVPVAVPDAAARGGQGAGGGRVIGTVSANDGVPPVGAVLVVRTLDPGLATVLPQLGGLVAETGNVLSHLAILAREFGVPAVVGVPDAVARFPAGSEVVVDGTTGEVALR